MYAFRYRFSNLGLRNSQNKSLLCVWSMYIVVGLFQVKSWDVGCWNYCSGWVDHAVNHQEGIINRTEPAEPNGTEPFNSRTGRNRTRNRTEPERATTSPKNAGRTGKTICPNPTEPKQWIFEQAGAEANRAEPVPSCNVWCTYTRYSIATQLHSCVYIYIYT